MSKIAIEQLLTVVEQTNPEDHYDRFEQAWEAISDEPLLVSNPQGPRYHPRRTDGERYRAAIDAEAYESAAMILMWPFERIKLGSYRWELTNSGYLDGVHLGRPSATIHHPLSSGGGPMVTASFPTPGMAMLIAALRAHAEWGHEIQGGIAQK